MQLVIESVETRIYCGNLLSVLLHTQLHGRGIHPHLTIFACFLEFLTVLLHMLKGSYNLDVFYSKNVNPLYRTLRTLLVLYDIPLFDVNGLLQLQFLKF